MTSPSGLGTGTGEHTGNITVTENTETSRARHTLFSLCGLLLHLHVDLASSNCYVVTFSPYSALGTPPCPSYSAR
jgi:hypothetical protein